jgi:hypothetical protein
MSRRNASKFETVVPRTPHWPIRSLIRQEAARWPPDPGITISIYNQSIIQYIIDFTLSIWRFGAWWLQSSPDQFAGPRLISCEKSGYATFLTETSKCRDLAQKLSLRECGNGRSDFPIESIWEAGRSEVNLLFLHSGRWIVSIDWVQHEKI